MRPLGTTIYLDYSATTLIDPAVLENARHVLSHLQGNPASREHSFGWNAAEAVEEARSQVANIINAKPDEIIFTSCATESINLALKGSAFAIGPGTRMILTSTAEHEAVLGACQQIERLTDTKVKYLPVDQVGRVDSTTLANSVEPGRATLVAIIYANNEIGTINPIREAAKIAHEAGALFFTDATQAVGKIPVDVRADGIDMAAFSAHKIYGPKGVGAFFMRS